MLFHALLHFFGKPERLEFLNIDKRLSGVYYETIENKGSSQTSPDGSRIRAARMRDYLCERSANMGINEDQNKEEVKSGISDTIQNILDKTDIDEKVVDAAKGLKDKVQDVLDKTDIDEKVADAAKGLKDKVQGVLDKTDIDDKIVDGAKSVLGKIGSVFSGKDE